MQVKSKLACIRVFLGPPMYACHPGPETRDPPSRLDDIVRVVTVILLVFPSQEFLPAYRGTLHVNL